MAAYAALVSLMNTMEQIQNHPRHSTCLDKNQIESLREQVCFLLDFVESYNSHGGSEHAEVLESEIASAAYAAEDVIESRVVDEILTRSTSHGRTGSSFLFDLRRVIGDMDSVKEKVMEIMAERGLKDQQPTYSRPATSSRPLTSGKNGMVGVDDELIQLMDMLTGQKSNRQIISVVGMGGIGKTTLARNVYENLVVVQHFDIRAWVSVAQEHSVKEILIELLSCQRKSTVEINRKDKDQLEEQSDMRYLISLEDKLNSEAKLGEQLYKSLSGMRYLIVLDDMWNTEAWDKIKYFLPDNSSRSRILVTTRQSNLAVHLGSSCLAMNFLDDDKSWKLFCEKAFKQESYPPELEETGKKIAKKCQGLPLSIVVIGALLGKSYTTQEHWENVVEDINSLLNLGEDEQCLDILSLSYKHLHAHLKPCFLYMGIFLEGHEIRASQLIRLWIAEGFVKPNKTQNLEEIAEDYLKDLVDRNLILVLRWGLNGKIRTCIIHDLLKDLCIKIAEKAKFLCMKREIDIPRPTNGERRIVFHESIPLQYHPRLFRALQPALLARTLICNGGPLPYKFRLLRVLNEVDGDSLEAIFRHVNLRYLDCYSHVSSILELPPSITSLCNIQTLVIRGNAELSLAPSEIWEMSQLRHLEINKLFFLDIPASDQADQQDDRVLRNLQTLSKIVNFRWSEEVCKRIPNIKKLQMIYENTPEESEGMSYYCLHNVANLRKLETLRCSFEGSIWGTDVLQRLTFPSSLKKLSLQICQFRWEDLTTIGLLPHLEVLQMKLNLQTGSPPVWSHIEGKFSSAGLTGPEWNPTEGEFRRLKFLQVYGYDDLIYWNADRSHFPVLENLVLGRLSKLDEIPSGIGEIPTLGLIHLDNCSESAAISAMKISEEQESLGNESLQVQVIFSDYAELEKFKAEAGLQSFTSGNFQLGTYSIYAM